MIYWGRAVFEFGGTYGPIQDLIGQLQIKLGAPHELMMFERKVPAIRGTEVFIGMPTRALLKMFPKFREIDQSELPVGLIPLVIWNDGFEERFPDIFAKLHRYSK